MAELGPKMRDGLTVFAIRSANPWLPFADELLINKGYPPKVADSIISRLARRGWIEYGVSARTGWLTPEGRAMLRSIT